MGSANFIFLIVCVFAIAKAEEGYLRENPSRQLAYDRGYGDANPKNIKNDLLDNMDGIPGVAGKDYPIFYSLPQTGFDCDQQLFPGYYADPEANCQMYHICQLDGRKDSFLCTNGTLFNQERLVCEWWHTVDCSQARAKYSVNEAITKAMEDIDRQTAERKAAEAISFKISNSALLGEVHDAQSPPQGYKANANNNNNLEKEGSNYKHNRFSSSNYDNMEAPQQQPYALKRRDQITEAKFEQLSQQ